MKITFKLSTLCIAISTAMLVTGCNSESSSSSSVETTQSTTTANNDSSSSSKTEQEVEPAVVNIGVNFPESEIAPAWIGDSQEVQISFYDTEFIGSNDEAISIADGLLYQCGIEGGYISDLTLDVGGQQISCDDAYRVGLRGEFAAQAVLNTVSPTTALELAQGKYRVEASFYNSQGLLQETSVSYVTLDKGNHSLKLTGLEATWTATTPLFLQLLNQNSDTIDWDTGAPGVQSAAEALGITDNIIGIHLPTALTYPSILNDNQSWYSDQLSWSYTAATVNVALTSEQLTNRNFENGNIDYTDEQLATVFKPLLRITDGEEEKVLPPRFEEEYTTIERPNPEFPEYPEMMTVSSWAKSSLAFLSQEYTDEGNDYWLNLGSLRIGKQVYDEASDTITEHFAFLDLGSSFQVDEGQAPELIDTFERYITYYPEYGYWNESTQEWTAYEDLTIARVETYSESGDYWSTIFRKLNGIRNEIINGNTITGNLVELQGAWTYSAWWNDNGNDIVPAIYLDAALNELAIAAGLKAAPASNCDTLEYGNSSYSNEYMWDETNNRWVAGTFNHLIGDNGRYFFDNVADQIAWLEESIEWDDTAIDRIAQLESIQTEYLAIADLNNNGIAELFEEGVYTEDHPYCHLEYIEQVNENGVFTHYTHELNCSEFTVKDTVRAWEHNQQATMCVQPFELTASQLALNLDTEADNQ